MSLAGPIPPKGVCEEGDQRAARSEKETGDEQTSECLRKGPRARKCGRPAEAHKVGETLSLSPSERTWPCDSSWF